ncbi:hypothetical protein KFK09_028238 [Dendrobium nobile]|uniref:Growth-regulating factor n=1 Tax=Dendrobium nobile TaxID=94219 RepID=A0A8T3A2L1_DENNO|nr:hypothetical protein KFK09_028238 [Dendrobium nobile]
MNNAPAASLRMDYRLPFTASQWEELEHQALIFKYLIAGIPVPPELLIPIRRSYESMAASFSSHSSLSYCSFYGKKPDPEPGRCRRTDGKKWRCSKDAYPDSKYCERHMHRGRNRSRKHVEISQTVSQSQSLSSMATIPLAATVGGTSGSGSCSGSLHGLPFGSAAVAASSQAQIDPASYGITTKDFRYINESKPELDKCSFFLEASRTGRDLSMNSSFDNSWSLMPSSISSIPLSKERDDSFIQNNYLQLQPMQDLRSVTVRSMHQQNQDSFFGSDFSSLEPTVKTVQPLLAFFDEWPMKRDSWSDLEVDERSNRASFATTQLSISIPMVSSDFSPTTSLSQNDE